MTATDLYQAAVKNMEQTGEHYGAARVSLANGDEVFCSVKNTAGMGICSPALCQK